MDSKKNNTFNPFSSEKNEKEKLYELMNQEEDKYYRKNPKNIRLFLAKIRIKENPVTLPEASWVYPHGTRPNVWD